MKNNNSSLSKRRKPLGILFDLDGTLLNTALDIADAVNILLKKYNYPALALEAIRPAVAKGTPGILKQAFAIDEQDERFSYLRDELLSIYQMGLTKNTCFFDGMDIVLNYLDQSQIAWGIVTNKPSWLAEPLLAHFQLTHRYSCLVAGDSLPQRKPHPAPLLHACQLSRMEPGGTVYVGDTEEDIQAAGAAGMTAIAAAYGYHDADNPPERWNSDAIIQSPLELIPWIEGK